MWFIQGYIEVEYGDESDYDGDGCGIECGDSHAERTNPAAIPHPPLHLPLHPPNNQSKPIVQSLFPYLQSLFPHLL